MRLPRLSPILFAVTALGISSVITQITLTRELLNIFDGNELIMGMIISVWLLLTGAGSFLGRFQKRGNQILLLTLVAVAFLPFGHLIALRWSRQVLAIRGAGVNPGVLFALLPLLLAPYCLLSGYLLTLTCSLLGSENDPTSIGRVYVADNAGDILGGALFSFVLIWITDTFGALYLPAALAIAAAALIANHFGYRRLSYGVWTLVIPLGLLAWTDADRTSLSQLFPHQRIEHVRESPYGRIVVTTDAEQVNFFENGIPLASTGDVLEAEETVHFALSQLRPGELSVLLISGGLGGAVREILKYPTTRLDYVELDPEIIRLGRKYVDVLRSPRVTLHTADGRKFVEQTGRRYDAVLMDLPPPASLQLNRFYTAEFFQHVKACLKPGGVFSFSLPGAANYISDELAALYRVVSSAGLQVFDNVVAYPAGSTVFALSSTPLSYAVGDSLQSKGIETRYMSTYYLQGTLTPGRIEQLRAYVSPRATQNRDLYPHAFRSQLRYRLSVFDLKIGWMFAVLTIGVSLLVVLARPVQAAVATTGFVSIGMEVVVLLLLQIHTGYVYQRYGVVITLFMSGLAVGGLTSGRVLRIAGQHYCRPLLLAVEAGLMGCALAGAILTLWGDLWRSSMLLYFAVVGVSFLTGAEFPLAAVADRRGVKRTASALYTADLVGAAAGAILCALLLAPNVGVPATLAVLGSTKLLSMSKIGICSWAGRKSTITS